LKETARGAGLAGQLGCCWWIIPVDGESD